MERKQYNREFKLEAVRRLRLREQPVSALARDLDIPRNKLYRWEEEVKKKGELDAFRGRPGPKPANAVLSELEQLRRRVELLEEENQILKKAEAYFTDTHE
jgi:transposase